MNPALKLSAYAAVLAVVLAAAYALGGLVGPPAGPGAPAPADHVMSTGGAP